MNVSSCRALAPLLVLSSTISADVLVVDQAGGGDFTTMHEATAAAASGDTLLVRPGNYSYANVVGKSLNVVAVPAGSATLLQVVIKDLAADQRAVLSGFVVVALDHLMDDFYALHVVDCLGSVRVEDCSFTGEIGSYFTEFAAGLAGASIEGSQDVVLVRCELQGGDGIDGVASGVAFWEICPPSAPDIYRGGPGLRLVQSNVALYQCSLQGGTGSQGLACGVTGPGGAGLKSSGSYAFLAGCDVQAGTGGFAEPCECGGDGGPALDLQDTWLDLLDVTLTPGLPSPGSAWGAPGQVLEQSGAVTVDTLPGKSRELIAPVALNAGATLQVTVRGEPGDAAFLAASWSPAWIPWSAAAGLILVSPPFVVSGAPLGLLGASGDVTASFATPAQLGVPESVSVFLQAVAVDLGGALALTGARTVHLITSAIPL